MSYSYNEISICTGTLTTDLKGRPKGQEMVKHYVKKVCRLKLCHKADSQLWGVGGFHLKKGNIKGFDKLQRKFVKNMCRIGQVVP